MAGNQRFAGREHRNRWRIAAWSAAACLLILPLLAMQFTDEVNWNAADFLVFGFLLASVGGTFELATRKTGSAAYRAAVGLALAAAFLLIWANTAVGIIGNEENDANLMYYGVLVIGLVGALIARFEPKGMARAMFAAAGAQGLVFVIALVVGWGFTGAVTLFFLAFWLSSARLFQKAAQQKFESGAV